MPTNYPTNLPGLDEARLIAIQALIVASLSDLNAALARDAQTPLVWTAAQVVLGDPETLTTSLVCVTGGGAKDATDMEAEPYFLGGVSEYEGYKETLYTNVYVYVHPDALPNADALAQVKARELTLARCADHLRKRVFNAKANATITLTSQEYSLSPDFDTLVGCYAKTIFKGRATKSFAGFASVPTAHLMHVGHIG